MIVDIAPAAFANMLLLSAIFGALLAIFLEVLRLIFGLFIPQLMDSASCCSTIGYICLIVRDIIFFCVFGVAFSVFVYYTNNGNVRFMAVVGVLIGFLVCYLSIGRLIRAVFTFLIKIFHKFLHAVLCPLKRVSFFIIDRAKIFTTKFLVRNKLKIKLKSEELHIS